MARSCRSRIHVRGTLTCRSPLHVGGLGAGADVDLVLAVDGAGRPAVPGTSLAGALRAWSARAFEPSLVAALFGRQDAEWASRLLVEDAEVRLPAGATTEVRDGVAIDRVAGAAHPGLRFDVEVLPVGTTLPLGLVLEVEPNPGGQRAIAALGHLLGHLLERPLRLGAGKTRGLGRLQLERDGLRVTTDDFSSPAGAVAAVRRRLALPAAGPQANGQTVEALREADPSLRPHDDPLLQVKVAWTPDGPLMVKAAREGVAVDALPLRAWIKGGLAPVLPGSSVKGALRSHAERIVRTLLDSAAPMDFPGQLDLPLVRSLFGIAGEKGTDRMGALFVDDCYARHPLPPWLWAAIETDAKLVDLDGRLTRAKLRPSRPDRGGPKDRRPAWRFDPTVRVAIDRWTGGAASGALYGVLEPWRVPWNGLELEVDPARLAEGERAAALALLLLVLRDFAQGWIPLGWATNRGLGAITGVRCSVVVPVAALDLTGGAARWDVTIDHSGIVSNDDRLLRDLDGQWRNWLQSTAEGGVHA